MFIKRRAWNRLATLCLLAAVVLAISLALQASTLIAQTVPPAGWCNVGSVK